MSGQEKGGSAPFGLIRVTRSGRVGVVTLDRPGALNALCRELSEEVLSALRAFNEDPEIGAIILTGSDKAFAAGADIREMSDKSFADLLEDDLFSAWDQVSRLGKPLVAAVAGYALGGGCELAMLCDFIIAADTARFGQPETGLGILPGIGGTQRLARAVGKALAMDMILTGRIIDAEEALRSGLVARVVPAADLMHVALEAAENIASRSLPAIVMARDAVNRSQEVPLQEGLRYERSLFRSAFATEGQREGMAAFLAKRKPRFNGC